MTAEKHPRRRHPAPASRVIRVDPEVYAELDRLRHPDESLQAATTRIIRERLEGRGGRPAR